MAHRIVIFSRQLIQLLFGGSNLLVLFGVEWTLKSKRVLNVELLEHYATSCWLFGVLHTEPTVFQFEQLILLAAKQRDQSNVRVFYSSLLLIIFVWTSVEECVLFPRVTVEIAIEENFSLLMHVPYQHLWEENRRMKKSVWLVPLPIQVTS